MANRYLNGNKLSLLERSVLWLLWRLLPTTWTELTEEQKRRLAETERLRLAATALSSYLQAELPPPQWRGEWTVNYQEHHWKRRQILRLLELFPPESPLLAVQYRELEQRFRELKNPKSPLSSPATPEAPGSST